MREAIEVGSILIERARMPDSLLLRGDPFADGWISFRHSKRRELETTIDQAGLTFFYLAGEIKAAVFGLDREALVMRVVKKLIRNVKAQRWNGLEITRVAMRSFLGVPYATAAGHARHIQKGLVLSRDTTLQSKLASHSAAPSSVQAAVAAWEDEGGATGYLGDRLAAHAKAD